MKKLVLAMAFVLGATGAFADGHGGKMAEPVMEEEVVMEVVMDKKMEEEMMGEKGVGSYVVVFLAALIAVAAAVR